MQISFEKDLNSIVTICYVYGTIQKMATCSCNEKTANGNLFTYRNVIEGCL